MVNILVTPQVEDEDLGEYYIECPYCKYEFATIMEVKSEIIDCPKCKKEFVQRGWEDIDA